MAKNSDRVHLLEVRAKNIKTIREVRIVLNGDTLHEIRGDSGQGKSSILQSIHGAFCGLDPSYVRQGENVAEIEIVMSEAAVRRIIHRDGEEELLVQAGNMPLTKAQAKGFLKALYGQGFDPRAWADLGADSGKGTSDRRRQQRDELVMALPLQITWKEVVATVKAMGDAYARSLAEIDLDGIDFDAHAWSVLSEFHRRLYEYRRKEVNPAAELAERKLRETLAPDRPPMVASAGEAASSVERARANYYGAQGKQKSRTELAGRVANLRERVASEASALIDKATIDAEFPRLSEKRDALREKEERLRRELSEVQTELRAAETRIEQLNDHAHRHAMQEERKRNLADAEAELTGESTVDIEALAKALHEAEADLLCRQMQDAHDAAVSEAQGVRERVKVFNELVALFRDGLINTLLSRAELPVPGLAIEEDQVVIDGKPLWTLGTSEQYKVGVAIGAKLNQRLGFTLIDRAESIGRKEKAAIIESAKEHGVQLIMTILDPEAEPADGRTVMRDGLAVKG